MSGELREFIEGVVQASVSGKPVRILRSIWGKALEPQPGRAGTWRVSCKDWEVEVTKMGPVYGYLRVRVGSCTAEGLLIYKQPYVVYKPQSAEGCTRAGEEVKYKGFAPHPEG